MIEKLDTTTTKINDPSNILNYNITKESFEIANTGKVTIVTNKKQEESKERKDQRKLKEKVHIDVYPDQSLSNYYFPKVGDMVLGKITNKFAFSYEVEIGAYCQANLDALEFDGATKKNKPNLDVNSLVYCRIKSVDRFSRPILSCISPIHHKSWASGESYFGPVEGGFLLECSKKLIRYLQGKT